MLKQVSFAFSVLLSTFLITTSQVAKATEQVGLTAGQLRVDESGAATYNIPINAPAGRAGVAPQVSLAYSSNNLSEGPTGVGWSLTGLSAIARCPQTPIYDNERIQEVKFNDEDKFCLDGQRLILKSGTYGSAGSTYRTEVDSFSTITAFGSATTSGPLYFEIKNKAGETHYYGDASDAHTASGSDAFVEPGGMAEGGLARSWAISVIKDIKNNYIVFNYEKNTSAGTFYIDNIQYTGNTAQSDAPFAEIDFIYEAYEKGFKGYMSGSYINHNQLLKRIDTKVDINIGTVANGNTYRSYFIDYETSAFIEERTLLTQVQECTDTNRNNCLPATTFNWQRPALTTGGTQMQCVTHNDESEYCYEVPASTNYQSFSTSVFLASGTDNESTSQIFDINGDGYQDIVYVDNEAWQTKLGPYHATAIELSRIGDGNSQYALNIDYNGDGTRDLLVADSDTDSWTVISYQPSEVQMYCPPADPCSSYTYTSSKSVVSLGVVATGLEGEAQVMDVNGDGMEDIVFRDGDTLNAYLNNNGSFAAAIELFFYTDDVESSFIHYDYETQTASMKSASGIDINGDGRSDLISKVTTKINGCYVNDVLRPNIIGGVDCAGDGGHWVNDVSTSYELLLSTGDVGAYALT